ncbi:hypothetical protein EDD17DRAFT_1506596 [Pisolithus thermaeus]|nr:hypothetical protein EDD17DRAFT_1506596 [Pisolithus thermaeus]
MLLLSIQPPPPLLAALDLKHPHIPGAAHSTGTISTAQLSPFHDSLESTASSPAEPSVDAMSLPFSQHHHLSGSASSHAVPPHLDSTRTVNLMVMDHYIRGSDKYAHSHNALLDQRRMSEPAMYGTTTSSYPSHPSSDLVANRYHLFNNAFPYASPRSYSSPLHRTSSLGSSSSCDPITLVRPSSRLRPALSPFNPSFSGGDPPSNMGVHNIPLHADYGPSPPGTGTSSSSNALATRQHPQQDGGSPPSSKQYSFVSLPGNAVKKRPRRRYDEIERLYRCSWPNCTKAYGTLNHLNAHVTMQKHGQKRSPNEFKELRKQWRKAKKEEADARALNTVNMRQAPQHPSQRHFSRESLSDTEYSPYHHRIPQSLHPDSYATSGELHDTEAYHREITLLTPPAGYEPTSLGSVHHIENYGTYELYPSDIRPDSGHSSVGKLRREKTRHVYVVRRRWTTPLDAPPPRLGPRARLPVIYPRMNPSLIVLFVATIMGFYVDRRLGGLGGSAPRTWRQRGHPNCSGTTEVRTAGLGRPAIRNVPGRLSRTGE